MGDNEESRRLGELDEHHVASGCAGSGPADARRHVHALEEAVQDKLSRSPSPLPTRAAAKTSPRPASRSGLQSRGGALSQPTLRGTADKTMHARVACEVLENRSLRASQSSLRPTRAKRRPMSASADGRSLALGQAGKTLVQDSSVVVRRMGTRPRDSEEQQVRRNSL